MWFRCSNIRVCVCVFSRRECGLNRMETGRCRKQTETLPEPPLLRQAVKTSLHVKGLSLIDRRFVPHHSSVSQMWYGAYALAHFYCRVRPTAVDPGSGQESTARGGLQWRKVDRKFRKYRSSVSKMGLDPHTHRHGRERAWSYKLSPLNFVSQQTYKIHAVGLRPFCKNIRNIK